MSIRTPKVPIYSEEFEETVFITLPEFIQELRMLFVCKKIEFPFVNELIALILLMDFEEEKTIYLYLNSHGGKALSAMSLYDTMQLSRSDVNSIDIGLVASAASLILVGGEQRIAFPRARVLIKLPPTDYFCGTAENNLVETEKMYELRNTIVEIFAQKTRQPKNVIENDLERNTFMSASQALDYGILDRVLIQKPWKKRY